MHTRCVLARRRPLLPLAAAAVGLVVSTASLRTPSGCPWNDEMWLAEAKTLPCFSDVVLNTYPRHTARFQGLRLRAATIALTVDPHSLWALDMAAVAQIHLRKLPAAEKTLLHRLEVAPGAYETYANLGTLYTFTGQWDLALLNIDAAMKVEPKAHFGREKYHRAFVVFLSKLAKEPGKHEAENFLGVPVTDDDRKKGSPERFDAVMTPHGFGRDAFDAIDAMVTVYGAGDNPHLLAAAGDLLALYGKHALASAAYTRALKLKHPAPKAIESAKAVAWKVVTDHFVPAYPGEMPTPPESKTYEAAGASPPTFADEEAQLDKGLAVWTANGLEALYAGEAKKGRACPVGSTLQEATAGSSVKAKP